MKIESFKVIDSGVIKPLIIVELECESMEEFEKKKREIAQLYYNHEEVVLKEV